MKSLLFLFLSISLTSSVYANVAYTSAPSDDLSATKENSKRIDVYQSDSISTGQSSTRRDFEADRNYRMCKDENGSWLRPGDLGYVSCMSNLKMLSK